MNILIRVLGIGLTLWCVVYLTHVLDYLGIIIAPNQHQAIFLGLLLPLTFLLFPAKKGTPGARWYDWVLIGLGVVPCAYVALFYDVWMFHSATTTQTYELVFCLALLIPLLEGLRRTIGIILPIVTLFFLLHPLLSAYLPSVLFGRGYSVERVCTITYMPPSGIFSLPLNIAATILIIFLIFGQLLLVSGGGQTLINIALSMVGRVRGGGAKSAVVASGLFGSLSGSPAANVAITGTFTIPLMKSTGYKPNFAAGVEAVASTGGTLLPPVMGVVAFIMAEWLNVPYVYIAMIAFLPAVILYASIFAQVDFAAAREGLSRIPSSELPSLMQTLKQGIIYLIPIAILIYFLFGLQFSPETSALWATISIFVVTLLRKKTRLNLRQIGDAMNESARSSVIVGLTCAMAGIMMASVSTTGLATSISGVIVEFAAGSLFLLLLLAALASFVFGMGIGSIPSYIFVAIMVAPALTQMGIKTIAAHLFVFWTAMSAFITPPFCVSAYVASAIAKSSPMRTGFQAVRIGAGFLLIPFAFIYNPGLILQSSIREIVIATIAVAMGMISVSAGLEGYLLKRINWGERGLLLASGILLLVPRYSIRFLALAMIAMVVLWQIKGVKKSRLHI
jgi:TRAP transporter 4TM/12TM fusion protein